MKGVFQVLSGDGLGYFEVDLASRTFVPTSESSNRLLIPGFVDIHIHGAFGMDFMSATSAAEIGEMADRLVGLGYETLLPTTVTAPPENILKALRNLPYHPAIAGFHLEGP